MLFLLLPALAAPSIWPDVAAPAPASGGGAHDAALLIGIEDYAFLDDIPGARANLDAWRTWLQASRGVPAGRIQELRDGQAIDHGIRDALATTIAAVEPGGTVWVVWIGHGAPGGTGERPEAYLLGADANNTDVGIEYRSVPRSEVETALLAGKQGATVLVLDTCFSGYGVDGKPLDPEKKLAARKPAEWRGTPEITVLAAAQANQSAALLPGEDRPAFSYLALGALRGWGDLDGDGWVSAREVVEYTSGALSTVHRTQRPQLTGPDRELGRGAERGPDLLQLRTAIEAAARAPAPTTAVVAPTTSTAPMVLGRGWLTGALSGGGPVDYMGLGATAGLGVGFRVADAFALGLEGEFAGAWAGVDSDVSLNGIRLVAGPELWLGRFTGMIGPSWFSTFGSVGGQVGSAGSIGAAGHAAVTLVRGAFEPRLRLGGGVWAGSTTPAWSLGLGLELGGGP